MAICLDEPLDAKPALDTLWGEVQRVVGKKAKKPRPLVCAMPEPVYVFFEDVGQGGMLLGYYNPKTNEILAAFSTPAYPGSFPCVVIHEMLHAIFGPGHKNHIERMAQAGCSEPN